MPVVNAKVIWAGKGVVVGVEPEASFGVRRNH